MDWLHEDTKSTSSRMRRRLSHRSACTCVKRIGNVAPPFIGLAPSRCIGPIRLTARSPTFRWQVLSFLSSQLLLRGYSLNIRLMWFYPTIWSPMGWPGISPLRSRACRTWCAWRAAMPGGSGATHSSSRSMIMCCGRPRSLLPQAWSPNGLSRAASILPESPLAEASWFRRNCSRLPARQLIWRS